MTRKQSQMPPRRLFWLPGKNAAYQLVLSVDIIPNPPAIKSYSGPSEPGNKPYQLSSYPDAVAALKHGLG